MARKKINLRNSYGRKIEGFIASYAYNFSQDFDRIRARILDAKANDPKRFKKFITDYNKKIKKNIATIKADAKKYKKKGIFYNAEGMLSDQKLYKLDLTQKK
jgi:hypothetical protein